MNNITAIVVNGITIYINRQNGCFFDELPMVINTKPICITKIQNPKITSYTFCLNISNSCNLNCDYCFNISKNNTKMSSYTAIQKLDELFNKWPDGEKYFIDLSGKGEPLLNLNTILEINDYCKFLSNKYQKEIVVSFVTNGLLLTKKTVTKLQDSGILFGISIDGPKYIHNLHRKSKDNKDAYNIIIQNVKQIKNKEYLGCAITITNDSFDLLNSLLDLSKYFNTLSVKPVRSSKFSIDISTSNWKNEYWKLVEYIIKKANDGDIELLLKLLNGDDYFGKFILRTFLNKRTINRCDAFISRFCVDEEKLYGCPALSFDKKNEIQYNNIPSFEKLAFSHINMCKDCEVFFYCGGECFAEQSINNGINKKMCIFKKMLISYAMYLKIYFIKHKTDLFLNIIQFCETKEKRYSKNNDLYIFLNKQKNLSFIEGKNKFYNKDFEKK